MAREDSGKPYDLEERTFLFARDCRRLLRGIPRTASNVEDGKQLLRASGSVGANYIEANDALSKKDFLLRCRISRREARESRFFLRLLDTGEDSDLQELRSSLVAEATELVRILSAIIRNAEGE